MAADPVEHGYTLPYRWYSEAETLRLEQERVFARSWTYGGRAEEVAEPGSYVTTRAGDVPLLVTRARDGELDLSRLRFHSRSDYTLDANWKIAVENFLECYHCSIAHPQFSSVVDVDPDAYVLEPHPTFASAFGRIREQPKALPYDPHGEVARGQFHLLFPNVKLNVMPGRANLSIGP